VLEKPVTQFKESRLSCMGRRIQYTVNVDERVPSYTVAAVPRCEAETVNMDSLGVLA
jgi:hypothetical protein